MTVFIEIAVSLLAGALSLLFPLARRLFWYIAGKYGIVEPPKVETYSERLERLLGDLTRSSAEVDSILGELTRVAQDREQAVKALEKQLSKLTDDEQQLKHRIQDLRSVPLPVAEHFARLTEPGEKRSAQRDYLLFGAGLW